MNLTGDQRLPSIGRRLKGQLVLLLVGLTAALTAAALAGAFERDSSTGARAVFRPPEPPASSERAASVRFAPPSQELVNILVASESDAARIESTISTMAATFPSVAEEAASVRVIVLDRPEKDAQYSTMAAMASRELMQAGVALSVIDLRPGGRSHPPARP